MPEPVWNKRDSTPEAHVGRVAPARSMKADPRSWTNHQAEIGPIRQTEVGADSKEASWTRRGRCEPRCLCDGRILIICAEHHGRGCVGHGCLGRNGRGRCWSICRRRTNRAIHSRCRSIRRGRKYRSLHSRCRLIRRGRKYRSLHNRCRSIRWGKKCGSGHSGCRSIRRRRTHWTVHSRRQSIRRGRGRRRARRCLRCRGWHGRCRSLRRGRRCGRRRSGSRAIRRRRTHRAVHNRRGNRRRCRLWARLVCQRKTPALQQPQAQGGTDHIPSERRPPAPCHGESIPRTCQVRMLQAISSR